MGEALKQYHRAQAEAKVITQQQGQIDAQQQQIESLRRQNDEFQQRLTRLEALMGTQLQAAAAPNSNRGSSGGLR